MSIMRVNPTRMELTRLKRQLLTARRGHKLLKDKQDELMRIFLDLVRETRVLRRNVDANLDKANRHFIVARSVMQSEVVKTALMVSKQEVTLKVGSKNLMSVDTPLFSAEIASDIQGDMFSYGYAFTSGDLDDSIKLLHESFADMLKLAEKEKSAMLLSAEIEKTRRRVNALEHVMIPDLKDTIKYITMKLDENERSNVTRLMKIKDMMLDEAMGQQTFG